MTETFKQMALRVAGELGFDRPQEILAFATRIRDELCKGQEPVLEVGSVQGQTIYCFSLGEAVPFFGTKLYLHPAPIPADMVMVPRAPTGAMAEAGKHCSDCRTVWDDMIAAYEREQTK